MAIFFMVINCYFIHGYYISDYWWLLMAIILVTIGGYSINDYFINGHYVSVYWWVLY
jgi:hypothetical protein